MPQFKGFKGKKSRKGKGQPQPPVPRGDGQPIPKRKRPKKVTKQLKPIQTSEPQVSKRTWLRKKRKK